jgi:hypothetical protein
MTTLTEKPRIFRSAVALVCGWVWMVFAGLNFIDLAIRGRDMASLVATAVLLTCCGIAYVAGIRPHVAADASGVRVRNPFKDADLPWKSVRKVDAAESLRVHYTAGDGAERIVRAWVLPNSPRARAKAERQSRKDAARLPEHIAKQVAGKTHVVYAVEQLSEMAEKYGKTGPDTGVMRWSLLAVASVVVPFVLLVVTIVLANT